jgi:hypothetical protein
MSKDPFGFDAVAAEPDKPLDISSFAPKARKTDVVAAKAVREVARDSGFTRRAASKPPEEPAAPQEKPRKRRVNLGQLLGVQDRYPDTERAQLNMLAPVPVVLRWRKLLAATPAPAWEVLEAAMDALEAAQAKSV